MHSIRLLAKSKGKILRELLKRRSISSLRFAHVDVFSPQPLSGNGLSVFYGTDHLDTDTMMKLTREMRQFESIFINNSAKNNTFTARVFTQNEELSFAGHPLLGGAVALHGLLKPLQKQCRWRFNLKGRLVDVMSNQNQGRYIASMEQGVPLWVSEVPQSECLKILRAVNLDPSNLYPGLPLSVISTGLPYLVVPLSSGIDTAKISNNITPLLLPFGAKEIYLYDVNKQEGRNWDNSGTFEDIATGSAAGPVAAYLFRHAMLRSGQELTINQGKYLNRPSRMKVLLEGNQGTIKSIKVSGDVCFLMRGILPIQSLINNNPMHFFSHSRQKEKNTKVSTLPCFKL